MAAKLSELLALQRDLLKHEVSVSGHMLPTPRAPYDGAISNRISIEPTDLARSLPALENPTANKNGVFLCFIVKQEKAILLYPEPAPAEVVVGGWKNG